MSNALEQAKKAIKAEVHMISGCQDSQTSADVSNVAVCFSLSCCPVILDTINACISPYFFVFVMIMFLSYNRASRCPILREEPGER
jgi:hypothetical protein